MLHGCSFKYTHIRRQNAFENLTPRETIVSICPCTSLFYLYFCVPKIETIPHLRKYRPIKEKQRTLQYYVQMKVCSTCGVTVRTMPHLTEYESFPDQLP